MAKRIKQFRYYGDGAANLNEPAELRKSELASGTAFLNYTPIYQLGIQALPGTKFYINNADNPIILNSTGIYELELKGTSQISNLNFSLSSLDSIDSTGIGYLLVDILYGEEE